MKNLTKLILLITAIISSAHAKEHYDYDGDGINDKTTQEILSDNSIKFTIWISSLNYKNQSYKINPILSATEPPSVYADNSGKGILIVDNSSMSRIGGELLLDIYKWFPDKANWILVKRVNGVGSDMIFEISAPDIDVTYVKCCHILGDSSEVEYLPDEEVITILHNELKRINQKIKQNKLADALIGINQYKAAEYAKILNNKNIILLNDLAFYLEKTDPIASAILLEKIVEKYPDRIVAKLNLADSYWSIKKENAPKIRRLYQEYKDLMTEKGLENKIPSRVFERTKS